ncbi:hypothetical protein N2152v2_006001 [Parachlorella kessleri]
MANLSNNEAEGPLQQARPDSRLQANLDPLLRALQQQRVKQAKRLLQLQSAAQLNVERREAVAVREERQRQRLAELEDQRRQQAVLRAQHAQTVERRRQMNLEAKQQQEEHVRSQVQAKLHEAAQKQAALQQRRQLEQVKLATSRARLKQATVQNAKQRAELAAKERQRQLVAKVAQLDVKLHKKAEQHQAAEVVKKEEERRREAVRQLALNRAELEEQERKEYFQRKQQQKEQELAKRREELDALRQMKQHELELREDYARQRREHAKALEQQRLEHVRERVDQKAARAEQLAQHKSSLKVALNELRREIARQEEQFKRALGEMQGSGTFTSSKEVAELQALLQGPSCLPMLALPPLASIPGNGPSRPSSQQQQQQQQQQLRPASRASGRNSRPGSAAPGLPRTYAGSMHQREAKPTFSHESSRSSTSGTVTHEVDVAAGDTCHSPAEPEPESPDLLQHLDASAPGSSVASSPRIPASWRGAGDDLVYEAHPADDPNGCNEGGDDAGGSWTSPACSVAHSLDRLQVADQDQHGPLGGSHCDEVQAEDLISDDGASSPPDQQHRTYIVGPYQAAPEDGHVEPEAQGTPSTADPREQLQAMLQAEVQREAEREQELAAAYTLSQQFLAQKGPQFGWPASVEELDKDSKEVVQDAFASDPTWSTKGSILLEAPAPLRAGRIVVELLDKEAPKAAENFRCLATGEKGVGKSSKKPLHYKGCRFHRIVKGFVCQGGDIVKGLKLKHDAAGIVGMANSGRKNTNTSQFYFTLAPAPKIDGQQVVFGRVVEGLEILRRIDEEAATAEGQPRVDVIIADCGIFS